MGIKVSRGLRKGREGEREDGSNSELHVSQGQNPRRILVELRAVVDDSLTDGGKVFDLAVAIVGEQRLEPIDVLMLLLAFVVTVGSQLEKHLVVCPRQFFWSAVLLGRSHTGKQTEKDISGVAGNAKRRQEKGRVAPLLRYLQPVLIIKGYTYQEPESTQSVDSHTHCPSGRQNQPVRLGIAPS